MKQNLIENRQVRIFISSTFRDMQDERDYLVAKVFPALRRYCAERDVALQELDLRWGISEEESKQGKVVDICLKEIRNTTPFFIGILGDRYGWVPTEGEQKTIGENTSVLEDYPWVRDDLQQGTSITEIEIQEGVLRSSEKVDAYFYFRSPAVDVPDTFREKSGSREAAKLDTLKTKLREQNEYPVKDYSSIEELGNLVEADFKVLVDKLWPQGAISELEKERLEQHIFAKSKCAVYLPFSETEKALDEFASSDERAIVITGDSGMGKSALLANWIEKINNEGHEPHEHEQKFSCIFHAIGESRSGGDYRKILTRLIGELNELFGQNIELNGDQNVSEPKDLTKELQALLFLLPSDKKFFIVLDGGNKLNKSEAGYGFNAKQMTWLPQTPKNVKFVFSTTQEDDTADYFRRMEYKSIALETLDIPQREKLIVDYLASYAKKLTPAQVSRIAADNENANPLVLRSLLDELRIFGVFEKLDELIDHYLSAESISAFFDMVLERIEKDFGKDFVKDVLSFIAVSHDGLFENEIITITKTMPLYWSQLFNAIDTHLVVRNGFVVFAHNYFRDAVWQRYLTGDTVIKKYRAAIIAYSKTREQKNDVENGRVYDELAFQYVEMKDYGSLYQLMLDPDICIYFWDKGSGEYKDYWDILQSVDTAQYDIKGALAKWIKAKQKAMFHFQRMTFCCDDKTERLLYAGEAAAIAADIYGEDSLYYATSLQGLTRALIGVENYDEAYKTAKKAIPIVINHVGEKHSLLIEYYSDVATAASKYPDKEQEAVEYMKKALDLSEELFGSEHAETIFKYGQLGYLYGISGNSGKAEKYFAIAKERADKFLGKDHFITELIYGYMAHFSSDLNSGGMGVSVSRQQTFW